jgi:predicted nucleic acid-binding Zn ribbon protein
MNEIDPGHADKKEGLKGLGVGMVVVGGILTAIGLGDFFSGFGDFDSEFPGLFFLAFIGLPMVRFGWKLAGFGYLGEISRYTAGEVTPVVKDAMAHLRDGAAVEPQVKCPSCGVANDTDAAFCDHCGATLSRTCDGCGTANDPDSKFCDSCGRQLS